MGKRLQMTTELLAAWILWARVDSLSSSVLLCMSTRTAM